VKICGVTSVDDAQLAVDSGADLLGVNLIPSSKRFVDLDTARRIVDRVKGQLLTVLVLADPTAEQVAQLRDLGADYLQLHGNESIEQVTQLGPKVFKAARIGSKEDAVLAAQYPGEMLLVDAKVPGVLGGSGTPFDWALVENLASSKKLILAGGLTANNVAAAMAAVHPWAVDVASGVEDPGNARRKSPEKVRAFLTAVRTQVIKQPSLGTP
jgi:phosphoribosylanthranilate isomerase